MSLPTFVYFWFYADGMAIIRPMIVIKVVTTVMMIWPSRRRPASARPRQEAANHVQPQTLFKS